MKLLSLVLLALCLVWTGTPVIAAPGDPDPSFGSGGVVNSPFFLLPDDSLHLHSLALLPDGRIVAGGRKREAASGRTRAVIAVLGENGETVNQGFIVDNEWSPNFAPAGQDAWINRIQTLPTGEILYCGGHSDTGGLFLGQRMVVGRLRADLTPDTAFGEPGGQGWRRIAQGLRDLDCTAIEQLRDGDIAVGGGYIDQDLGQPASQRQPGLVVARLTSTGELDTSFGSSGAATLQEPTASVNRGASTAWVPLINELEFERRLFWVSHSIGGWSANNTEFRARYGVLTREGGAVGSNLWAAFGGDPWVNSGRLVMLPELSVVRIGDEYVGNTPSSVILSRQAEPIWALAWFRRDDAGSSEHRSAGLAVDGNGRILSLRHITPPGGNSSLVLKGHDHAGNPILDRSFGSGIAVPGGSTERLEPGDLVVQINERILVVTNRRLVQGATVGPSRPVFRRFLGLNSGGAWALDLLPNAFSFGSASVRPNQPATSEIRVIEGLSANVRVPAQVSGGEMQVNFGAWTRQPTWVRNGDVVRVRGFAPAQANANHAVNFRAGGIRQANSWNSLTQGGSLLQTAFTIQANQPALPGLRCSSLGTSTNCTGTIPDNNAGGLTSSMTLTYGPGESCNFIRSVRVGVDISHSYVGDLRITLRDPNGQTFIGGSVGFVNLLNRPTNGTGGGVGSCSADDVLATFDPESEIPADSACALFPGSAGISGVLKPSQSLNALTGRRGTGNEGASSSGTWQLTVRDLAGGDIGTLNDWSLDLSCSQTLPGLADLATSVSGPGRVVAGTEATLNFSVQNNGPAGSGSARFEAELPFGIGRELRFARWTCQATAGSTCTLPASGCLFGVCPPPINPSINLAAGGRVDIAVIGTVDPQSAGNQPLVVEGRAWIPLAIGGAGDPEPGNDIALFSRTVELDADLQALNVEAWRFEANRLRLRARYTNQGPSLAARINTRLSLPPGYQIEPGSWRCQRDGTDCGGFTQINLAGRELELREQGSVGDGSIFELEAFATWTGTQPAGLATLVVLHGAGAVAQDPVADNNGASSAIPTSGSFDRIFASGLD